MNDYQHLLKIFNDHLASYSDRLGTHSPRELYQPGQYILSLGGKRVRPLLALIGCELCGTDPRAAVDVALSVELFHNFSLIHDDILDAAPLRRKQPTVHHKFGNNVAILAGDVMLVQALLALDAYPAETYKTLSALLQRTAIEVCEGQQLDMNFEKLKEVSVEEYIRMITLKTAVLLGCSLRMGAVCAGAESNTQKHLYDFGCHIGIAFQLLDDLLDCFPGGSFGKQVGGDICANKKTFLLLKAFELAGKDERDQLNNLMSDSSHEPADKVQRVTKLFSALGVDRLCRERADHHTNEAIAVLEQLSCENQKKVQLRNFALSLLQRNT